MSTSQLLFENLKPLIIYLNTHPVAHYVLIFITFTLLGILLFSSRQKKTKSGPAANYNKDLSAIAGDDIMSSQLDLAKAYIEMNQKIQAKKMLQAVLKQGSDMQQKQAHQLLQTL